MRYKIVEIDLADPLRPLHLSSEEEGVGLIVRWQDQIIGFRMWSLPQGTLITREVLEEFVELHFGFSCLTFKLSKELSEPPKSDAPATITIAICTKDRAERLSRLLTSLEACSESPQIKVLETLVIDNNSQNPVSTRNVCKSFGHVRYVLEPKTGLNFARNAALENASSDWIAFLDDDVVVDRHWLAGLGDAVSENPDAGGFTGPVLPWRLDSKAQIFFEQRGGFGRGFSRREFRTRIFGKPLHPVGAGEIGAGCNMAFSRSLLLRLGGFDEALDTGAPLPGGGRSRHFLSSFAIGPHHCLSSRLQRVSRTPRNP